MPAGRLETFQHYVNLHTTERKLDGLLERHRFASVKDNLENEGIKAMLRENTLGIRALRPVPAPEETPALLMDPSHAASPEGLLTA
jgi:hypothetical protein